MIGSVFEKNTVLSIRQKVAVEEMEKDDVANETCECLAHNEC